MRTESAPGLKGLVSRLIRKSPPPHQLRLHRQSPSPPFWVDDCTEDGSQKQQRVAVDRYRSAKRWALSYEENAHLVRHHAMLTALSLGLGSTIIGLVAPIVDRSKELRQRYEIPKDNRAMVNVAPMSDRDSLRHY